MYVAKSLTNLQPPETLLITQNTRDTKHGRQVPKLCQTF